MTMAVDFSKILQKQAEEIEKPKPLPIGSYICNNPKLPEFKGVGKNETPCAEFSLVIIAPSDDVDPADLKAYGDWKGKTIRHRMFLTEGTEFRTKEELKDAFQVDEAGKNLGQMFNETINRQVLVTVKHRPSEDGTDIFMEVEKLAAV
jgi:hypothetical protein